MRFAKPALTAVRLMPAPISCCAVCEAPAKVLDVPYRNETSVSPPLGLTEPLSVALEFATGDADETMTAGAVDPVAAVNEKRLDCRPLGLMTASFHVPAKFSVTATCKLVAVTLDATGALTAFAGETSEMVAPAWNPAPDTVSVWLLELMGGDAGEIAVICGTSDPAHAIARL